MKHLFYTLEGIDGCGKTTLSKEISAVMTEKKIPHVVVEAYPRDPESMKLREMWIHQQVPDLAVVALVLELRKRVLEREIVPALLAGKVVISDRWHDSTVAYNSYGMGIPMTVIEPMIADANSHLYKIIHMNERTGEDLTFLFNQIEKHVTLHIDISLEESRRRIGETRVKDAFERSDDKFFERVRQGYKEQVRKHGNRAFQVDASIPPNQVAKMLVQFHLDQK